jgi:hypothetical protein
MGGRRSVRAAAAVPHYPVFQDKCIFAVVGFFRSDRFHDQRPVEPLIELVVGVRVIQETTGYFGFEFVNKAFARHDRRLGNARDTIHGILKWNAVPVNRRPFGKVVSQHHPNDLARFDPDFRTRYLAVVGPGRKFRSAAEADFGRRSGKVKLSHRFVGSGYSS